MDPVGVKTFADGFRFVHKIHDTIFVEDDVDRGDGFVLVESPDVQLVDRIDSWDLVCDGRKVRLFLKTR